MLSMVHDLKNPHMGNNMILKLGSRSLLDWFTKTFFWNFQKCWAVLCYILIDKQMLHYVFCSNIAPSLSSGTTYFTRQNTWGEAAFVRFGP